MKNTNRFSKLEKAQVLPVVVVAMIAMIIFAALILDGGSILLQPACLVVMNPLNFGSLQLPMVL